MSSEVATAGSGRRVEAGATARDWPRRAPLALFALACAASFVVLVVMGSQLTFFLDDWAFLLHRNELSLDSVMAPHNEHIVIAPVLIYQALQHAFGMDSLLPFSVVADLLAIAAAVVLFIWLRRRVGDWLALAGTIPVLFLGTAAEDLLFPFQIGYFGALALAIAALLLLERDDPALDAFTCIALVGSLAFSTLGLPFVAGAAVWLWWVPRRRRRLWVVAVPVLLYGLWWLGWGQDAESHASLKSIATSPSYVLDGFASSVGSLLGLSAARGDADPGALDWGRPLLVAVVGLAAWRVARGPRPGPWFWAVLAIALAYWGLAASNAYVEARAPTVGRYQYVGVVLLLMLGAELLRGVRPSRAALIATFAVVAVATAGNVSRLVDVYDSSRTSARLVRADLGALELASDNVAPAFILDRADGGTDFVPIAAGDYLPVAYEFGSPAYSEAEILEAPGEIRPFADKVSAAANGLSTAPGTGSRTVAGPPPQLVGPPTVDARTRGSCLAVAAPADTSPVLDLPPRGVVVTDDGNAGAQLAMRRWSTDGFPIGAGEVPSGGSSSIVIPPDAGTRPWQLELRSAGAVEATVCGQA